LERRDDGQVFEEAGVFGGSEVFEERVREEEFAGKMFVEADRVDFEVAADDSVNLFKVGLNDADAGQSPELVGGGDIFVLGGTVIFADADKLSAEFGAKFVEVEDNGEARAVADEELAVAVIDVATGTGDEDATLVLRTLALGVEFSVEELLVREATGENDQQSGDDEIK
jgi:hypothetical protein